MFVLLKVLVIISLIALILAPFSVYYLFPEENKMY